MKNLSFKFFPLVLLILAYSCTQNVFACSCRGLSSPYQTFKNAKAVFIGTVVSGMDEKGSEIVEDKRFNYPLHDYHENKYRFVVDEWFKGGKTSEVFVSLSINMCQFGLSKGGKYLIYAGETDRGLYTWTFCSRTNEVESAQDDIQFLRELLQNKPEPRIYGSIKSYSIGLNAPRLKFIDGIKIVAQSGKRKYITFSDKNGLYRFKKLPNGEYKVSPELPKKYILDTLFFIEKITLVSEEIYENMTYNEFVGKSAYSDFRLALNNEITGKVLDAEGKPLEKATVRLIPIDKIDQIIDRPLAEYPDGRQSLFPVNRQSKIREFSMFNNSPGKYILAVEIFAPFASGKDRFRMYYPETTDPRKAKIITVDEFDRKTINLKLPDGYVVRDIIGSFLWGSGRVIESDGSVSLERLENSDNQENVIYDSQGASSGKFRFQGFENAVYWIHAKAYQDETKPVKIKVGKINPPIDIRLFLLKDKDNFQ